MSIVLGIVKIAEREAEKAHVSKFKAIDLEIGNLSGVEYDALEFAWEPAVKGTVLESAEKHIHKVQAKAKCADCDTIYNIAYFHDECPNCGSFFKEIIQGRELRVKSLDLF